VVDRWADGAIRAAGAVVWRTGPAGPQIVLVHRPRYDDWAFPKGKSGRGEHPVLTAVREVAEETGLRVVLGRRLTSSEYEVDGEPKRVSYWAARCTESLGFVPGHEVDEVTWVDLPLAPGRLTYDRDRELLAEFASGPPSTIPFMLLRHAHAGARLPDPTADLARPLDRRGAADAVLLSALLASFGSCRVISSPARRCVETVRPYAEATGTPTEIGPEFSISGADGFGPAARRTAELMAEHQPTLICAHRENLPTLLEAALDVLGVPGDCGIEPPLGKGSFAVLQSADGVLVSSERHDLVELPALRGRGAVPGQRKGTVIAMR
jgi:8-oxo-(d)GTP phosphatase